MAVSVSPFSYPSYADDILELLQVHPIALYRRLAEPSVSRRKISIETRAWQDCMDKWTEELGAKEKAQVSPEFPFTFFLTCVGEQTRYTGAASRSRRLLYPRHIPGLQENSILFQSRGCAQRAGRARARRTGLQAYTVEGRQERQSLFFNVPWRAVGLDGGERPKRISERCCGISLATIVPRR